MLLEFFCNKQSNKRGWNPTRGFLPYFLPCKTFTGQQYTEIFCMADDFYKFFDAMIAKYALKPIGKRKYHRNSTMSKAEVMLIMILFHTSGYRCFKHFYLEKVCKHLRHLYQIEK